MPHVIVKVATGRSESTKQALALALTETLVRALECEASAVSVAIEDIPATDWMATVYETEIVGKADPVYKAPGYGPLGT